jgi:methylmalonyl-CoA mutase cobalamin-binding domain/chain
VTEPTGSGTQALDRAVQLVSIVVEADGPLGFAELQEATGLAKSTTSRLLAALERGELLERDENGGYVAGSLFWLYAARHDPWEQLVQLARPAMERVGSDTQETVHLSVIRGEQVVQVAQVDSQYLLGTRDWTQVDVPVHTSALGKVFFAWGGLDLPGGPLVRLTPQTLVRRHRRRARGGPDRDRRTGAGQRRRRRRGARHLRPHQPPRRASRRARPQPDHPRGRGRRGAARTQHTTDEGRRGMTSSPEEILRGLFDETLVGNAPRVLELTEEGLALGMEPQTLLFEALIPSLEEVGARFERGDFFVPEMLIAGRAMAGAMERLRPLLAETGVETVGKFVMGTVKGDVHDIGKNLVNIMLEGAGFEVIDLGVQVAPEKFVSAIEEHHPDIVGFSAFLTTTMPMFKANMNALQKAGLRDSVVVMVGGAPVTQEYADAVGADGYAADASATVKKAKALLHEKRAKVTA